MLTIDEIRDITFRKGRGYKDEDVDADDEYDADESTSEEVAFNSFNSAIESLPMSERAKFASLVSSAAISMSCK